MTVKPGLTATEPGLNATSLQSSDSTRINCNTAVKKTLVFLTVALVMLSELFTDFFSVKKVGKEFKVNLSNSEMSFLTIRCQSLQLSLGKALSLFANNSGSNG